MNSSPGFSKWDTFKNFKLRRGALFTIIILTALIAFEIFNYSTTDYALTDVLGTMKFAGIKWATILSIAFCGIDFAGIARLFSPEPQGGEPTEVWYLFGAWLLAATMNALLTWWGVSMALVSHTMQSSSVIDASILVKAVPIFVAVMVWLIRILIIGTLSLAGNRLLRGETRPQPSYAPSVSSSRRPTAQPVSAAPVRPAPSTQSASSSARPGSTTPTPASRPATSFQPVYRTSVRQEPPAARPSNRPPINEPDDDEDDAPGITPPMRNRPEPVYTSLRGRNNNNRQLQ